MLDDTNKGTAAVNYRQAIETKYLPCTNFRPSRIVATASAGRVIVSYEHGLNITDNHARAAKALADKFGWRGVWVQGALPNGNDCFVNMADQRTDAIEPAFVTMGEH